MRAEKSGSSRIAIVDSKVSCCSKSARAYGLCTRERTSASCQELWAVASTYKKLVYFASSVFWRAAVHRWRLDDHELSRPTIGPKYEAELRSFLQGQQGFPKNAAIWVVVSASKITRSAMLFPYREQKTSEYWQYKFTIPGIAFRLFLGGRLPGEDPKELHPPVAGESNLLCQKLGSGTYRGFLSAGIASTTFS